MEAVDTKREHDLILACIAPFIMFFSLFLVCLFNGVIVYWLLIVGISCLLVFGVVFYIMHAEFEIKEDGILFKDFRKEIFVDFKDITCFMEEKTLYYPFRPQIYKVVLRKDIKISEKFLTIKNRKFEERIRSLQKNVAVIKESILNQSKRI